MSSRLPALALLFFGARLSAATDLYVSPAGKPSADCSLATPCDFATALRLVLPGDTVHAAPGAYPSPLIINSISGAISQRITLLGGAAWVPNITITNSAYLTLDGIHVQGAKANAITMKVSPFVIVQNGVYMNSSNYGITCGGYGPGTVVACNYLVLQNLTIGGSKNHAIYLGGPSVGVVLSTSRCVGTTHFS